MPGHSKWANIKRQKAVVDAKKGVTYAKLSAEIMTAVKLGGSDPNMNIRLRTAIDKAKSEGVPNDNIHRAIEKGVGASSNSNMESLIYEGYGPGGVAVLVKCLTDNRNRTAGDVRSYFSKYGGNLGDTGCVSWMFIEQGVIEIKKTSDLETIINTAIELAATDIDDSNEDVIFIYCQNDNFNNLLNNLEPIAQIINANIEIKPTLIKEIETFDQAKLLIKLIDILENHDDVSEVISNFDINDEWLDKLSST